ncbi:hypothetical protein Thini_0458 [Thiothrix nivea DSM 5205]|uniref:COR domain-containing protein n=2 Tax=Thiothrix nivea TaxID=1031 RepID=A0A656HDJ2_THINJ|nr:COR domain-containing protein [Thiothrix nivea]EIJ33105.1 hypothetical protein Thini_0458 [Thiothrix nivea DSM 5205]
MKVPKQNAALRASAHAATLGADTHAVSAVSAATCAAGVAGKAASVYTYTEVVVSATAVERAVHDASAIAVTSVTDACSANKYSAAVDYKLISQINALTPKWWYSQPLWECAESDADKFKLAEINQHWFDFTQQLRNLDLDFIANDLNDLWESKPLSNHAKNYLEAFSYGELNDPAILRRLILEGETAEHIHAVRVLLLGPGGAGKSSLADRLQGRPLVEQDKKLTVGVDYLNHQSLNLYKIFGYLRQEYKPLDLYLWDFGGQTIFHGLHRAFLHENCVYVLVVDSRHEQAPDEWLYQIREITKGRAVTTLLVTNWYEKCETRQNEVRLRREFPDLLDEGSFFYFSCHESDAPGFKDFVQALEKACLDSQRMVLKETLDVNEALQQQYQDDVFLESADLEDIIEQVTRRPESVETLPNKLEQLGFLVRVDSDDQHYCLKPAWAVDNAYAVLYSPLLREAKGVLKLKTLQREFKGQIATQHMTHLVEFLQMRSLCRKLTSDDGYFFPDAAPADELPEASELLGDKAQGLAIRFDLPYLPLGFHAALVHRLFVPGGISSTADIWRQGFILRKNHSRAVVHYLTRKSVVELALAGDWQDFAGLLNTVLVNLKAVLLEGKGIREEQIVPSVVLDQQVFSVHSAERLVGVLGQINNRPQLVEEIKAMAAGKVTNYYDSTHNEGDGQYVTHSHDVEMNQFLDKSENTITTDQRQQIAVIVDELLKQAGSLPAKEIIAVGQVKEALEDKGGKPESRKLLGSVWNGLKDVLGVTKTTTDIAKFAMEHQAGIVGAITTAVALL